MSVLEELVKKYPEKAAFFYALGEEQTRLLIELNTYLPAIGINTDKYDYLVDKLSNINDLIQLYRTAE